MEEEMKPEEIVETIESKIAGHQAQTDQMQRMIEENKRQIELGDDVEGRKNMIKYLTSAIENEKAIIEQLKAENTEEDK